jgi:hypothetical protein
MAGQLAHPNFLRRDVYEAAAFLLGEDAHGGVETWKAKHLQ